MREEVDCYQCDHIEKALTVWQPYASLLALGIKTIETRSWETSFRGPVAIHAAKKWDGERAADTARAKAFIARHTKDTTASTLGRITMGETLGKILGVAQLVDCVAMSKAPDAVNAEFGWFGEGRFGWVFANAIAFDKLISISGKQRLWNLPGGLL